MAQRVRKEGRGCLRIAGRILYLLVPFHLFDDAKATGNAACMHACSSSSFLNDCCMHQDIRSSDDTFIGRSNKLSLIILKYCK